MVHFVQYYDFRLIKLQRKKYSRITLLKYFIRYVFIDIKLENFKSMFKLRYARTRHYLFIRLNIRDLSTSDKFVNLQYCAVAEKYHRAFVIDENL